MKRALLVAGVLLLASRAHAQGGLAAARTLYASASYEDALASLASPDAAVDPNQVDEYRALCYLALGQSPSAEQALERILNRAPLYTLNELDVSPKLVAMFQDVKQRVIPSVARKLYAKGKSDYEAKDFAQAAAEFRLLMAAVDEKTTDRGLADIRQLADGFLKLSEAAVAAAAPPKPAAAPAGAAPAAAVPAAPRIYSAADADVKPPSAIEQQMPRWAPTAQFAAATLSGILEIVIDERGEVESAGLVQGTGTPYDAQVVAAARRWHFRPATRGAAAVK